MISLTISTLIGGGARPPSRFERWLIRRKRACQHEEIPQIRPNLVLNCGEDLFFFLVFTRFRGRKDIISTEVLSHSECVGSRLQKRPPCKISQFKGLFVKDVRTQGGRRVIDLRTRGEGGFWNADVHISTFTATENRRLFYSVFGFPGRIFPIRSTFQCIRLF